MKARFNTRGARCPGARLIAGLSALGLAAGLLTGCSNKDPDEALCEDFSQALKNANIESFSDFMRISDSEKLAQFGQDLKGAAEKNSTSELSDPIYLLAKMIDVQVKISEDMSNTEAQAQMRELGERATDPAMDDKAKQFAEKCPVFEEGRE